VEFKGEENSIFLNFGKVIVKGVGDGYEGAMLGDQVEEWEGFDGGGENGWLEDLGWRRKWNSKG
jgi:hypothetical protein